MRHRNLQIQQEGGVRTALTNFPNPRIVLDPVENVWKSLRCKHFGSRLRPIIEAACWAWQSGSQSQDYSLNRIPEMGNGSQRWGPFV